MTANLLLNQTRKGSRYSAIGTTVAANIKSSGGRVLALSCTNLNAGTRYFQLHNLSSAPSGGETPFLVFPAYANSGLLIVDTNYFGKEGVILSTGISFGFSTTPLTYTAGAASDAIVEVRFA